MTPSSENRPSEPRSSEIRHRAALVALLGLPGLGPVRLRALVGHHHGSAVGAWDAVRQGRLDGVDLRAGPQRRHELTAAWRRVAADVDPLEHLAAHRRRGIRVLLPGDDGWPSVLTEDPDPPAALFTRGDVGLLSVPAVAVVGTRRCTAAGARVAAGFGADLAAAGVAVVSGLATGIDGAAHRGCLAANGTPVGVVGTGLDHVYPAGHAALWAEVADRGVLVSESALGAGPERWRFPARNRLIAGLAHAVVVVESGIRGGSMSTVGAAIERHRDVYAVPGSVLSPASAGTNALIVEGALVARDAADLLVGSPRLTPRPAAVAEGLAPEDVTVLEVLSDRAASVEEVVSVTGLELSVVTVALLHLEATGLVRRRGQGYERS